MFSGRREHVVVKQFIYNFKFSVKALFIRNNIKKKESILTVMSVVKIDSYYMIDCKRS